MTHVHAWTLCNAALRRYRCACGVLGYAPVGRRLAIPYLCQQEFDRRSGDRKHCGKGAVVVGASKWQRRCEEHRA